MFHFLNDKTDIKKRHQYSKNQQNKILKKEHKHKKHHKDKNKEKINKID